MNKFEEIFYKNRDIFIDSNMPLFELAKTTMVEFGEICFEAGKERHNIFIDDYQCINKYKYVTYEDFLKEIEDETGN